MSDKPPFPRKVIEPRKIPVYRETRASVTRMLDSAYNVLGQQFDHYSRYSASNRFSEKECAAFAKLVSSVTSLQESERRQISQLALGALSDAELDRLAEQATGMVANRAISSPNSDN